MTATKYSTLTLGDCLTLLDELDGALAIIDKTKRLGVVDIGAKSMLTVLRREIAGRVLEIIRETLPHNPPRFPPAYTLVAKGAR